MNKHQLHHVCGEKSSWTRVYSVPKCYKVGVSGRHIQFSSFIFSPCGIREAERIESVGIGVVGIVEMSRVRGYFDMRAFRYVRAIRERKWFAGYTRHQDCERKGTSVSISYACYYAK